MAFLVLKYLLLLKITNEINIKNMLANFTKTLSLSLQYYKFVVFVGFFIVLSSCQDEPFEQHSNQQNELNHYEGGIVLENPYVTINMKMALDTIKAKVTRGEYKLNTGENSLRANSSLLDQFSITNSHTYIKFTPQTEDEVALLKQDSTLVLSDYPLDYEFDDSFHDNRLDLPEGQFPEYFAAVPVDKALPNVSNQALGDLYIPEDDIFFNGDTPSPVTKKTEINNEEDLLHHLLYEAYSLVGKEQELLEDGEITDPNTQQTRWIFGRKWYPSGTLTVWDGIGGTTSGGQICQEVLTGYDYSQCTGPGFISLYDCATPIFTTVCETIQNPGGGFVPLQGAQVLMRQWFTVRQGITNANGYFSTGFVRGKARYIIQWERYQYSIRNGSIFQAETRGPKLKNAQWNHNIIGGDDEYHALIHTAAHDYYYGDRFGTMSPPLNEIGPQMKIAAVEVNSQSGHVPFFSGITFQILPVIYLKAWGEPSDEVYGTTIHELAHAAHRNLDINTYSNVVWDAYTNVAFTPPIGNINSPMGPTANNNRRLMETWATTLETLFTVRRYRDLYGVANYTYNFNNFQDRTLDQLHYTSAGVDMIEGNYGLQIFNQSIGFPTRPVDRVNGYTINQLENALINSSSWWEWRDRIFNVDPNNPTRNNLGELFNNW